MGTRRTYSAEFQQQAVELTRKTGNTVEGIARDSTLTHWLRAAREHGQLAFPGQGQARLSPEIKRLKRELETVRQERETLKAAAVVLGRTAVVVNGRAWARHSSR